MCKSVGPDGVHTRLLKELSNHLCKPLAMLFNNSLVVGELPNEWKQGRNSAISKKCNRKNAGGLTSIICKCMEQCVKDHIVNHMIRTKLFSMQQFGFIKGRSANHLGEIVIVRSAMIGLQAKDSDREVCET